MEEVDVEMDDIELIGAAAQLFEHHDMIGDVITDAGIEP